MGFTQPQQAFDAMIEKFDPKAAVGVDAVFQWNVIGDGGGTWHIVVKDNQAQLFKAKHASPTIDQASSVELFLGMVNYEVNPMQAFMSGKLKLTGDMMIAQKILELFPL